MRSVTCPGARGIIESINSDRVVIRRVSDEKVFTLNMAEITNFSLAARKAWKKMPARQVGRPKGSTVCDRLSVTIRVDRDLWQTFRMAEDSGIIMDRTLTLNNWIRHGLQHLTYRKRAS